MDVLDPPQAALSDERLLAFAERQARPLLLGIPADGDDRVPVPVEATGPDVPLPPGLHRMLDSAPYPRGRVDSDVPVRTRVLGTIAAAAPQRFEVRSAVNPHRAYPAAHCFYSAQLFLLTAGGAWHYDASGHLLRPVAGDAELDRELDGPASLAVVCHLGSVPTRYRELRWSLSLCEAGHLLELLAQVGSAHRLAVRTRRDLPDAALLDRLGLRARDGWTPAGAVELDAPGEGGARPPAAGPDTGMSWAQVLFERSAGRANKGFSPAPVPLAATAAEALLAAIGRAADGVPSAAESGVDVVLASRDVEGLDPGCHLIEDGRARRRIAGPDMDALQRSFAYPATQMSIAGCPAALLMITDHAAAVREGGERGLRLLQLRLGAIAQAAGMALTPHGGFLRPARSFDPDPLAAALRLEPTRLPAYVAPLGVNRFTDLLLDVRR
ncbi:hypothetical protein [Glycomyces tenuis]|uniref:hypothetical protein n=1 Tax=Glycomyces tenuis TaxID=58116 RepID=UPI00040C5E21|nr:hypothetical protein [Glycomyces tenuis]